MTTREKWIALEETFTIDVQFKTMDLRSKLQNLSKDGSTVSQYFIKAKTLAVHLAVIGEPVSDKDFLLYILCGLGLRYNNFISNIKIWDVKPSINIVQNYLEELEKMLHKESFGNQERPFQANLTKFHRKNGNSSKSNFNRGSDGTNKQG